MKTSEKHAVKKTDAYLSFMSEQKGLFKSYTVVHTKNEHLIFYKSGRGTNIGLNSLA